MEFTRRVSILIQGLRVEPWALTAMMQAAQLEGDVRRKARPRVMGDLAVIELVTWAGRPILEALAQPGGDAGSGLAALLRRLRSRCYGLQVVIAPQGSDASSAVELSPEQLAQSLPQMATGTDSTMIFVGAARGRRRWRL